MSWSATQQREHRAKLKAQGICTVCHTNKAKTNRTVCEDCVTRQNKRRDLKREDLTLCHNCQNKLDEFLVGVGERFCGYCKERRTINRRRYYIKHGR
jgi:hypothetical protein